MFLNSCLPSDQVCEWYAINAVKIAQISFAPSDRGATGSCLPSDQICERYAINAAKVTEISFAPSDQGARTNVFDHQMMECLSGGAAER